MNGDKIETYRDLMFAIAKRVKELADEKMDLLRLSAGYNCDTP